MKHVLLVLVTALVATASNFALFIFTYNRVAVPFLHESQRMDNADFIMTVTLGGYVIIALIFSTLTYQVWRQSWSRSP